MALDIVLIMPAVFMSNNSPAIPMSEVRGRSREDPMPEGWQPRGVTPRPRSGAAVESARLQRRRNGREELPKSEVGAVAGRSYPTSEVRGGSREELPCE